MSHLLSSPLRVSPENRELPVAAETVDPLDLSDRLDSLDLQERRAERLESGNAQRVCVLGVTSATPHVVHYWGDRILVWRPSWLKCSRFRAGSLPIWRSMDRWLHVEVPLGKIPNLNRSQWLFDQPVRTEILYRSWWADWSELVYECVCVWMGECGMCCKALQVISRQGKRYSNVH